MVGGQLMEQEEARRPPSHSASSAGRHRCRLLSADSSNTTKALAAKTASFSGFQSDTCLSVGRYSHARPPGASASSTKGRAVLPGILDGGMQTSEMLALPSGEVGLCPTRKRKSLPAAEPSFSHLVDYCLPPAQGLLQIRSSAPDGHCGTEETQPLNGEAGDAAMAANSSSSLTRTGELSTPQKTCKRGGYRASTQLLQLPLAALNSSKGRRPQLLSPSLLRLMDVTNSPLSVISQASTCALLSSASSLDSCSQPATPNAGLLDSGAYSPLPLAVAPVAHKVAGRQDAAAEVSGDEGSRGARLDRRARCDYEVYVYGAAEEQNSNTAAALAGLALAGTAPTVAKAGDEPCVTSTPVMHTTKEAALSEESTVATAFLSSPSTTASLSPLRLPIPARGLRRLQHPRLQQAKSAPAAEEHDEGGNTNPPRSLRRLQLPRLRTPSAPGGPNLHELRGGKDLKGGGIAGHSGRGVLASSTSVAGALESLYSPIEGSFVSQCVGSKERAPRCADYSHESPSVSGVARGGLLEDAFEAAAHAAHVAAHAAARAAAHAAAHAALLKRKAAEAYWCWRSNPEASFSVYPDLDRNIHLEYNLYCAAWPEEGHLEDSKEMSISSTACSSQETAIIVGGPAASAGSVNEAKGGGVQVPQGHLVLGEGRYGKVVLAENRRTHEMMAVKMLDKRRALTDDSWDCRQELEVHRRLPCHPHVVSVLDVYEDRKSLYIVMELCDRNTLVDRVVADGAFTEEQAKLIFAQLLSGVMHCHNNNIVHRDLKPENVLFAREADIGKYPLPANEFLSRASGASGSSPVQCADSRFSSEFDGQGRPPAPLRSTPIVKITDFGSACYATPGELSGTACGTIHYLAPEVLAGNYYDGFLSDVWSLGVILYIIISATPPFFGESDGEVVQKIVAGSYSMSGYQWRSVSEECKDIIRRLLTVDPRCRMSLHEAIAHPWIVRITGSLSWPLSFFDCACCLTRDSYEEIEDEGPINGDYAAVCCCGKCHASSSDASALVLSPQFAAYCASPIASGSWGSAHPCGFQWPRN
ncbi:uncharacterized protein LOC34622538 [Cyclospora cayetanensis]|uniref:Uncharacterized protein LOC34622538 n=2 Tax=Cyclospora cayetanensis TaxID=88456 RepID=A0A6P5WCG4_9EIME|nr:uncharacterized protein LOC34622538 [Cyclospora cayetanensis]OEH75150.1 CAM CDPK domain-containing protein [Cyclospora cayetanensis]